MRARASRTPARTQEAMSHCGGMPRSAALRPSAPRSAPLCRTLQPRAPGVAVRAYTRAHALRHTQPHTYTCSRLFWRRLMCSRDPGTIESDAFSNCSTALLSASCTPDRRRESNDGNRRRTVPCQTGFASGTAICRAACGTTPGAAGDWLMWFIGKVRRLHVASCSIARHGRFQRLRRNNGQALQSGVCSARAFVRGH